MDGTRGRKGDHAKCGCSPNARRRVLHTMTETRNARASLLKKATIQLAATYRIANPAFRLPVAVPPRCLTKPATPAGNHGYDNAAADLILHVGDTLGDRYAVLDMLGTGTFGQVVRCRVSDDDTHVAVKVIKRHAAFKNQAWIEVSILRILHHNANDSRHIVRFHRHFIFRDHLCLVFELLSINLYQFLKASGYRGVHLPQLRALLQQLLAALQVLVNCAIIHCDLKPENVLLTDPAGSNVKLIDFGSACQLDYPAYQYVQSRFYRSPEVLLGMPQYDSQIDMWSLGCVAAELFLGIPLFPGQNEMNMVQRIVEMLGPMPDLFLRRCTRAAKYYNVTGNVHGLKSNAQYEAENDCKLAPSKRYFPQTTLHDIVMQAPWKSEAPHQVEIEQRKAFLDLLNGMLKVDPLERLSPDEAMQHPFIKGEKQPKLPWMPPKRPRRMMGRPRQTVGAIDIVPDGEERGSTGGAGVYANSAPTLRGHPSFVQGAEQAMARMMDNASSVNQAPMMLGAGSYIPPSSFNRYVLRPQQPPAPTTMPNSVGSYGASYTAQPPPAAGSSYGAHPGSYGAASSHVGSFGASQPGSYGAAAAAAAAMGSFGANQGSYGNSFAAQGPQPGSYVPQQTNMYAYHPLHMAMRHESQMAMAYGRGRLRGSPSKENLRRVPSGGELQDKGLFPFGLDDGGGATTSSQDTELTSPGNSGHGANNYYRARPPVRAAADVGQSPRKRSTRMASSSREDADG